MGDVWWSIHIILATLSATVFTQTQIRAHENEDNHQFKLIHMRDNDGK